MVDVRAPNGATTNLFEIVYEDEEILAINKPAGLVCHPTKGDEFSSLISRVRLYLGPESHPQMVNRLDRETSGVTLVAKNDAVALELRKIWENRRVEKIYEALVHGHPLQTVGTIDAPLGRDESSRVAIKDCVRLDGAPASTDYWVLARGETIHPAVELRQPEVGETVAGSFSLLKIRPHTGRKHQIRIHLAHLRHPVLGDKLYGGDEDLYLALVEDRLTAEQRRRLIFTHHALHAAEVQIPWRGGSMVLRAKTPAWISGWGTCETIRHDSAPARSDPTPLSS